MEVNGATSSSGTTNFVDSEATGFGGLTADDFMKMLITQLQNQDPTEPIGNAELLGQLATMQGLQSNIELKEALTTFSTNQQLTSAAGFIGKSIAGADANGDPVSGVADRAFLADGEVYLGIGSQQVPLDGVSSVSGAS